jgi:hypothetical protein
LIFVSCINKQMKTDTLYFLEDYFSLGAGWQIRMHSMGAIKIKGSLALIFLQHAQT